MIRLTLTTLNNSTGQNYWFRAAIDEDSPTANIAYAIMSRHGLDLIYQKRFKVDGNRACEGNSDIYIHNQPGERSICVDAQTAADTSRNRDPTNFTPAYFANLAYTMWLYWPSLVDYRSDIGLRQAVDAFKCKPSRRRLGESLPEKKVVQFSQHVRR